MRRTRGVDGDTRSRKRRTSKIHMELKTGDEARGRGGLHCDHNEGNDNIVAEVPESSAVVLTFRRSRHAFVFFVTY